MPNPDARLVRGVSIAVIVLSALALAGCLLLLVVLGIGGAVLSDPGSSFIVAHNNPGFVERFSSSSDAEAAAVLTALGLGLASIGVIWLVICHGVVLVAGIMGLQASARPEKLGTAFGWAIAGAALSLLGGNLITMALLIIAAVYLNKLRTPPYQPQAPMPPVPPYQP